MWGEFGEGFAGEGECLRGCRHFVFVVWVGQNWIGLDEAQVFLVI